MKQRKGQISAEVMYAVGVMLIIFIILTGISFNRRFEIRDTQEYLDKRNQCLKLADILVSTQAGREGTFAEVYARYPTQLFKSGVIIVDPDPSNPDAIEASCTVLGNIRFIPNTGSLPGQTYYNILNAAEKTTIYEKP
jgi:Na+-transporting NADH:ubiquinone oxidoreductase subunit NqrC